MAQSTWLTDVADAVGGYYGRIQPKYNAARNREIAASAMANANGNFESLFAKEFPDVDLGGQANFKARQALLSGIGREDFGGPAVPTAPMLSSVPAIQAPEPVKAASPMLTMPNQMYAHEAADIARGLMPSGPGSAEYKQSGSSAGATPGQAKESYDEYRKTANELASKSKSLAINKARLEYMKQMAPAIKAKMYGTEDADAFDREVEKLNKDVEGDETAQAKALTKKAELDQKIAVSSKQAETQQARIEVAKAAKTANDEWRRKTAQGKLDLDWAKLHIQNLQNFQKNALEKYKTEMQFAGSQGGTQQLFATQKVAEMMQHLTHGQAVLDRLNAMGAATGGAILDQDRKLAADMTTEFFDSVAKTSEMNDFELKPAEPAKGWLTSLFTGGDTGEAGPTANAVTNMPPSLAALTGARFNPQVGGGGDYSTTSESGTVPAPTSSKVEKPRSSKLGGGKRADGGAKKATSPKVGDKNAKGETWTGKRWL